MKEPETVESLQIKNELLQKTIESKQEVIDSIISYIEHLFSGLEKRHEIYPRARGFNGGSTDARQPLNTEKKVVLMTSQITTTGEEQ